MINNFEFVLRGDYQHIETTPENSYALLKAFIDKSINVIPNTFQQINPSLGNKLFTRMIFLDQSDGELKIEIGMDHLKISNLILKSISPEDLELFIEKVKTILEALNASEIDFGMANRVSLVTSHILDDDSQINDRFFMHFNNSFGDNSDVIEWKNRIARRKSMSINEVTESINLVNDYGLVQGVFHNKGVEVEFEGVQILIDINTVNENTRRRIEKEFVDAFLENALALYVQEYSNVKELIDGESD